MKEIKKMEKTNPSEEVAFAFEPSDFAQPDAPLENETNPEVNTTPKETHKIKYNGKEMELSYDELIANAQKGMNYDHILSERDSLKNSETNKLLTEIAKENGLKPEEFLASLKESKTNEKIMNRAKELEAEGMKPEHAKKMAELELKQPTQAKEPDEVKLLENEFKTLHQEFPETKDFKELSDFPKEVIELIKQGKSPLVAYAKYQMEEMKKNAEIEKNNLKNTLKDTGSLGKGEPDGKSDPFLEGLLGGLNLK